MNIVYYILEAFILPTIKCLFVDGNAYKDKPTLYIVKNGNVSP